MEQFHGATLHRWATVSMAAERKASYLPLNSVCRFMDMAQLTTVQSVKDQVLLRIFLTYIGMEGK